MAAGLAQYEWEALPEAEEELAHAGEWETGETSESGELFLGDIANWARSQWAAVQTPGSWQRKVALAAAKSAIPATGIALGTRFGGPAGGIAGGALGAAGASLLPDKELAGELEWEGEEEISPVRRIYLDAMMEHIAHEAAEAESEDEAAEEFLPLIPMIAGKLLPLAAKVLPKVAGKIMPRIARVVTRATPQLSRGVTNIVRTLYRDPRTRQLVRTVPSIARRTVTSIARQAAAGRPVTPTTAQRALAQQTYRVLTRPQETSRVLRLNRVMDNRYHGSTGTGAARQWGTRYCPTCGRRVERPSGRGCRCSCSC
jgi:hypothetical protein